MHLIQRYLLKKLNKFLKFVFFFPKPQVFNSRVIDQSLALGYCTILPKEEMFNKLWEIINNSWQNYRKVLVSSQGLEFLWQTENVKDPSFRALGEELPLYHSRKLLSVLM